jgi:hypothetical protein
MALASEAMMHDDRVVVVVSGVVLIATFVVNLFIRQTSILLANRGG